MLKMQDRLRKHARNLARFGYMTALVAPLCVSSVANAQATSNGNTGRPMPGMLPLPAAPGATAGATSGGAAAAANTAAPARIVVDKDYVLGPDDQISVESLTHVEVVYQGSIASDGKINVPQIGPVFASGKTLVQLQRDILRKMNAVGLVNPMVTVTLRSPRPQRVFVLNAKGGAGAVDIKPGMRISDVLALSGGLGDLPPELVDATLTRPGVTRPTVLDMPSIMRDSNSRANLLVRSGDTLRIVPRTVQVTFAGKVARSGSLDVPIGSTIVEAIALTGGVQEKAALTRASLKRVSGEIIPLNLYDVLVKGLQPPPIKLEDGDLIVVPEAQERVTVQGAVGRPGYYDIEDGKTLKLSEVIALAGGPAQDALLTRTIVQRADSTSQIVDLYKVLALHDEASNIALRSDDIITIPKYSPQVIIAGSGIRSARYVPIEEGTSLRILGALTQAGGLASEPEAIKITITRNMPGAVPTLNPQAQPVQPAILTVDPIRLYKENDLDANLTLQDGDVIMVTTEPRKVYLAGEIRSPGAYEIQGNEGLTEILSRAGGITEEGLLSGVIVERGGHKHTVDVFGALNRGDNVAFPLQTGDNIVVPKNMNRVLILPAVGEPGYHAIPEDRPMTVPEALNLANGTSGDALLKKVMLLRSTPEGLKPEPLPLDTADNWVKASKVVMKPGDILFVPGNQPRRGSNLGSKILRLLPFASMAFGSPFPLF